MFLALFPLFDDCFVGSVQNGNDPLPLIPISPMPAETYGSIHNTARFLWIFFFSCFRLPSRGKPIAPVIWFFKNIRTTPSIHFPECGTSIRWFPFHIIHVSVLLSPSSYLRLCNWVPSVKSHFFIPQFCIISDFVGLQPTVTLLPIPALSLPPPPSPPLLVFLTSPRLYSCFCKKHDFFTFRQVSLPISLFKPFFDPNIRPIFRAIFWIRPNFLQFFKNILNNSKEFGVIKTNIFPSPNNPKHLILDSSS